MGFHGKLSYRIAVETMTLFDTSTVSSSMDHLEDIFTFTISDWTSTSKADPLGQNS
jgi:hypothetical protein